MVRLVADAMTRRVVYLPEDTPLDEAAQVMSDQGIGDVVVTQGPTMAGIVTDRDIVVRAIAEKLSPATTTLGAIATRELLMIEQSATVEEAVHAMRDRGVRRLLVCDADRKLVGILSLSDVALLPTSSAAA
ncbi:CBS domain-containing protein [Actinoplanes xinjiangensis]|jgi:CBS domain-containing protein|uniref:CBS domain protein n=1 Tax=Actinoplanes xinjiangensis TaxID=512350 RepID=A0A316EK53_9ACTN|nr:CBS domain-containing protein [Actinoplanes xinjiangensis]PWK30299.1 CBS domain protein [Actinoplanes xinjiangensis]GIF44394.1 inosine-5-monophosphate dehydrogenase [Actinoplanes xinjiangensis]